MYREDLFQNSDLLLLWQTQLDSRHLRVYQSIGESPHEKKKETQLLSSTYSFKARLWRLQHSRLPFRSQWIAISFPFLHQLMSHYLLLLLNVFCCRSRCVGNLLPRHQEDDANFLYPYASPREKYSRRLSFEHKYKQIYIYLYYTHLLPKKDIYIYICKSLLISEKVY